jgi:hypothetical protein
MTINLLHDDISSFRIRRATAIGLRSGPEVDRLVKAHLDELDGLLRKAVFPNEDSRRPRRGRNRNGTEQQAPTAVRQMRELLQRSLTPKYAPAKNKGTTSWADESVASYLSKKNEAADNLRLSDLIDKTPELAQLKYTFLENIQEDWPSIQANARTVLHGYPAIRDFLLAHAYIVQEAKGDDALKNLILNHKDSVRRIVGYAAVSAARSLIDEKQLKVEDYNDDSSAFLNKVQEAAPDLSAVSFRKSVLALIDQFVFDRDEEKIIDEANIGKIPDGIKPLLIQFMQKSPVPITPANAPYYLPNFILQIMRMRGEPDPVTSTDIELPEGDFHVRFEDTVDSSVEVSVPAVQCAAQLFHLWVVGDELDVFGAVDHLTQRRLLTNGGMKIKSAALRRDLQDYVFNSEFIDLETNTRMNRTRLSERMLFYGQVFSVGSAQPTQDIPANVEFERLWKVLMIESARYLERAQASLHPDRYVSAQNVMQAVEDLQYNLSTTCTGMATIIAPIGDAELNFVLRRILTNPEILQQVVPEGGTWKRAVDKLNLERRARPGNAATLYNKARQGQEIINAIASYVTGDFDNQGKLSAFIGKVDGFITTQSILQRRHPAPPPLDLRHDDERDPDAAPPQLVENEPDVAPAQADEWDF